MAHKTYLGPKTQIQPTGLDQIEATNKYAAEEKHDGVWAEVTTDLNGKISKITSRAGAVFSGSSIAGLKGLQTNLSNTVLICELEAITEWAVRQSQKQGFKRLWIFDVVQLLGQDIKDLFYEQRRELLEIAFKAGLKDVKQLQLVRQELTGFSQFFKEVKSAGREGLLLKRLGQKYRPSGSDGKSDGWVRCKEHRFVDYVVTGIGSSSSGAPNLKVSLMINGKLVEVATIKNIPKGVDYQALIGSVVECKGLEVHSSGALRSGHFERVRPDKKFFECTLESALIS